MTKALTDLRSIQSIRKRYNEGSITFEQAHNEAQPTMESIHERARIQAAKRGEAVYLVTFAEMMDDEQA